jgi:hypothetical protein
VQNLLSSSSLSINLKIKVYITIILLVLVYGCGAWSLTLRKERRLRVFESRVQRRIFGPKRDEGLEKYTRRSSVICTADHILLIGSNREE